MKKMSKLIAILAVVALMAALCVSMAFAATTIETNKGPTATKEFIVPKDATIPSTASTTITSTLQSIDGVATTDTSKNNTVIIPLSTLSGNYYVGKTTDGQNDHYFYQTGDLLAGKTFTGGTYIFTVVESNYTVAEDSETIKNHIVKDSNSYTMKVYVGNDGEIKKVTVYDEENKKDIVSEIQEGDTATADANGLQFENKWYQELKGTSFENAPFGIKKQVALTEGLGDQDSPFTMLVSVKLPADTGASSASYVITKKDGSTVSGELDSTTTSVENLALKHDESIYFTSIPVGSEVTAKETDPRAAEGGSYTKSYSIVNPTGAEGIDGATLTAAGGLNTVVTNTYKTIDDAGILMNNLPYIILAVIALFGMTAYIVVRRKSDEG